MTRSLRSTLPALALALACSAPAAAHAQRGGAGSLPSSEPSNEPKTKEQIEAQQHFQRAKDLYLQGSYREAIGELESARALDPKAKDLVFNLGIVHERLGNFDEAITAFQKYEQMPDVTATEKARAENSIKRIEGAKREAALHAPKTTPGGNGQSGPAQRPPPQEDPPRGRIDTATIAAGSVSVAGLAAGTVFGIIAVSSKPSSTFVTGRDGSYADLQDKTTKAHTFALVSDVSFGVGIVAAAVTAYLFFGRTKEPSTTTAAAKASASALVFTPTASPTGGGAVLGGTF